MCLKHQVDLPPLALEAESGGEVFSLEAAAESHHFEEPYLAPQPTDDISDIPVSRPYVVREEE